MADRRKGRGTRQDTPANQAPEGTPDRMEQQDSGQDRPHLWPGQDEPEIRTSKTLRSKAEGTDEIDRANDQPLSEQEAREHPEGRDGGRYPGYLDSRREDEGD